MAATVRRNPSLIRSYLRSLGEITGLGPDFSPFRDFYSSRQIQSVQTHQKANHQVKTNAHACCASGSTMLFPYEGFWMQKWAGVMTSWQA